MSVKFNCMCPDRTIDHCECTNRSLGNLLKKNVQQIVWPATDNYSFFFDNKEFYNIKMCDQWGYDYYTSVSHNLFNRFYQSDLYNEKRRFRDKNIFVMDNLSFKTGKFYTRLQQFNDIWLNLNEYSDDPDRPDKSYSLPISKILDTKILLDEGKYEFNDKLYSCKSM